MFLSLTVALKKAKKQNENSQIYRNLQIIQITQLKKKKTVNKKSLSFGIIINQKKKESYAWYFIFK